MLILSWELMPKPVNTRHLPLHNLPCFLLNFQSIKAVCSSCFLKMFSNPNSFIRKLKDNFSVSMSCFVLKTKGQDIFQRSILGHILPEAMVCYLENYEPEKFSEIFLGEFDTPEAIWSSEMR